MDIHKPKVAHSWREFLIEIGTIVCGILIALGLEQAVEQLHWKERVERGLESEKSELAALYQNAYSRVLLEPCLDKRLAQIGDALLAKDGDWRPLPAMELPGYGAEVYAAPLRPWPDEVWKTLTADGTAARLPSLEGTRLVRIYATVGGAREANTREAADSALLRVLSRPTSLTRPERNQLAVISERLRTQNHDLANAGVRAMEDIKDLARVDPAKVRREIEDHSVVMLACRKLGLN